MRNIAFVFCTLALHSLSFADNGIFAATGIDTTGLSEAQKAEIVLQIEKMKSSKMPETIENAERWAEWGQGIGKAISSTAKELGVAVDEFSRTPVGQITMAVIVYKVIGKEVIRYFGGGILFIVTIIMWVKYFKRVSEEVTYHENGKIKSRTPRTPDSDAELWIFWVFNWITPVIGIAVALLIMFVS